MVVNEKYDLSFINDDFGNSQLPLPRKNTRMAVRYIRSDIKVYVCKVSFFSPGFGLDNKIAVRVLDISSRGLLIETEQKLVINQKVIIFIHLKYKLFKRQALVVRKVSGQNRYGIQFYKISHSLGDYLLLTQQKLVFK